jgi:hypothetical protein
MAKSFQWPRNDEEVQKREAAGLWKAQVLAKQIGEGKEKITLEVIRSSEDVQIFAGI